jgi:hypothetical protein
MTQLKREGLAYTALLFASRRAKVEGFVRVKVLCREVTMMGERREGFLLREGVFVGMMAIFLFIGLGTACAQNNDMYIYPSKGQSQAQQDKDRYECHTWAVQQTGFDPSRQIANVQAANQPQPSRPYILQGATRGAALGAVGGAITGNAGKGAAAGAAMGGIAGGFRRRDERLSRADIQADKAAAGNSARPAYMRAMAACLQGRGYTVN